jgi:ATP-dependent Clp protease ATP-binding subunit ClpX
MPAATAERTVTLYCSFCMRSEHDVARLIAGPEVYICGSCIGECNRILEEHKESDAGQR